MAEPEENPPSRRPGMLRSATTVAGVAVMLLISFFWFRSYFTGTQWYHSTWRETDPANDGVTERANWLFSNYGSFGLAWRRQEGFMAEPLPDNERKLTRFPASRYALSHVHPDGIAAWHWIHHTSSPPVSAGTIRHFYGHLFIPYWIPFLVILVIIAAVNTRERRPPD